MLWNEVRSIVDLRDYIVASKRIEPHLVDLFLYLTNKIIYLESLHEKEQPVQADTGKPPVLENEEYLMEYFDDQTVRFYRAT